MKFVSFYFLLFSIISLFGEETVLDFDSLKNREVAPLPETDERIDGYRKDYKKVKGDHIQLASKLKKGGEKTKKQKEPREQNIEQNHAVKVKKAQSQAETETTLQTAIAKTNQNGEQNDLLQNSSSPSKSKKIVAGYSGETLNGVREGRGKLITKNGDVYEGYWKKGKKEGHGIYLYASGIKYNGNWSNDKMDGYGSLIFPDGSSYYGDFAEGAITGNGVFKYADKAEYSGEWRDGKWHGRGRFKSANGRELNAIFANQQIVKLIEFETNDDD